jgi:hypothetical protein
MQIGCRQPHRCDATSAGDKSEISTASAGDGTNQGQSQYTTVSAASAADNITTKHHH